jgi:pyruvate/2-oxoglutarate/acetoin dehydrogenase E1 component
MFQDFITLAMDQIVNHAAKFHYMYGGQCRVPVVFARRRAAVAVTGPTHSQSLEAWFMHVPGLKVVAPAYGLRCQRFAKKRHPRRQSGAVRRKQIAVRR